MKSSFQTILLVVFGVVFVGAILVFSGLISFGSKKTSSTTPSGTVVMWGTVSEEIMRSYIDSVGIGDGEYTISYTKHAPENIKQDLIVALANQTPPDVLLFPSEYLTQLRDRLYVTPYASYAERTFRDTYIDGAQLFLQSDGIAAFPLVVDPLVVYYNKDVLAKSNFIFPPRTWNDLKNSVPLLSTKDIKNKLVQSTIALGTSTNVLHQKDILAAMILQTGNSIVSYDSKTNTSNVTLSVKPNGSEESPAAQALTFYTSFSTPTNSNYSWNISLPDSLTQFLSGKSAFYIGRASELFAIQERNPNLNFDVLELFQTGADTRAITFGSFLSVAMLKNAPNPLAAYATLTALSSPANLDALAKTVSLPPTQRSLLLGRQDNPYVAVFFKAALSAFGWLDPDPLQTTAIFNDMIISITSGKNNPENAIYEANKQLQ